MMTADKNDLEFWAKVIQERRHQESPKALRDLLADATTSLSLDKFKSDSRLLDIWLEYLRLQCNSNETHSEIRDKYKFLKSRVGATSAKLYMQWADFELNAGFLDRAVGILEAGMKLKAEPLQDLVNMKMEIQGSSKKDNASNVKSKSENIGFVSISPRIASVSVPIDRKRDPDKLLDSQPAVSIQDSSSLNNNMNLNGQRGRKFFVNQTLYWRISLVGRGASSKVYKVMTEAGEIYALKKVKLKGQDSSAIRGYLNEVELLKRLSGCEHIIRLVDSEVDEIASVIYLVLEYGEIDLARLLVKLNGKPLNPSFIRLYWFQMLEAVRIIHEENIIHSDLKPANFIVVEGSLKLIDFGIANAIPNDTTNVHRDYQTGTINYMAPEAIVFSDSDRSSLKLGRASDVWSLGCILYQLVYGQPPFANLTVLQKLHCIADPNYLISFTPIDDSNLMNVMRSCLNRNPKKRMGIPQLLNHRYLNPGVSPQQIPADCVLLSKVGLRQILGILKNRTKSEESDEDLVDEIFEKLKGSG